MHAPVDNSILDQQQPAVQPISLFHRILPLAVVILAAIAWMSLLVYGIVVIIS